MTIHGDNSRNLSFYYDDDLIDGLKAMMAASEIITGPINLGNPNEFTMLQLAKAVLEITGSQSKFIHLPMPQDDPKQRQPDISLAYNKLDNWKPTVELDEGLRKTIKYFKDLRTKS